MKPTTKKTAGNKVETPVVEAETARAAVETETEQPTDELGGTSDEAPTEDEVTEEADQGAEGPNPASPAEQEPEPEPATEPAAAPAPSGGPESVMMGMVPAKLLRMPLETVKKALIDDHVKRVEVVRTDRSIRDLQDRMRSTDGRCAPVIFTYDPEDKTKPPALFAGIESVAAAMNLELPDISVLLVANADASNAQGYITAKLRERPTSNEDDFLQRVHSFYE